MRPGPLLFILPLAIVLHGCLRQAAPVAKTEGATRVVSLDYCADQFVLKFVPREHILAVSPDAARHFSYMREAAAGVPVVRATAEDVLLLRPSLVVRSYGGGPFAGELFRRAGIEVVQLDFPANLDDVKHNITATSAALGAPDVGQQLIAQFERRLANIRHSDAGVSALYMTPGGVTTGPGSLVHQLLLAAGLSNYEQRPGWRTLPLERSVYTPPELLAAASFGAASTHVDPWTMARHPVAKKLMNDVPQVALEGAWTSCGGWFLLDAVEALAAATVPADGAAQ